MFRNLILFSLTFVALYLGSAMTVRADAIVFTDRSAFTAASTNLTTITFSEIPPNGIYPNPAGLTLLGVNFTATAGATYVTPISSSFDTGIALNASFPAGTAGILARLPPGITAVGSDILNAFINFDQNPVIVTLSTGETYNINLPSRSIGFIGFTADAPILSIEFRGPRQIYIDNFTFGQRASGPSPATPEPATMLLLSTGLAGAVGAIRRRRSAQA